MHRFDAAGQQLSRDGRSHHHHQSYYNSSFTGSNNYTAQSRYCDPFFRGDSSSALLPHAGHNRGFQTENNPRLACLLESRPSDPVYLAGLNDSSPVFYDRINRLPSTQAAQNLSYRGPGGMAEWMGCPSNKINANLIRPESQQFGSGPPPGDEIGFAVNGIGYVGTNCNAGIQMPAAHRYHPYHQPTFFQQQPQHQKSGFLEQLLKNRRVNSSCYGRASPSPANRSPYGTQLYSGGQQGPGMDNFAVANFSSTGGGWNGRFTGSVPVPFQPNQNVQHRDRISGVRHPNIYSHQPVPQQTGGNLSHSQNPFQHQFQQHGRQRNLLPIIKNEPEDGEDVKELTHDDACKSEVRYRKNHERMNAIMDETVANCEPISVSMERVKSLRHYVQLLKADVVKHTEDTQMIEEKCVKRYQDFMDTTAKFHSDYNKLCQPIRNEEYNKLVDKYYQEMKDNVKQQKQALQTHEDAPINGNCNEVAGINGLDDIMQHNENCHLLPKEGSGNFSSIENTLLETVGVFNQTNDDGVPTPVTPDESYFDNPALMEISREGHDQITSYKLTPPQEQHQPNEEMFHSNGNTETYVTMPTINGGNAHGSGCLPIYYGGEQPQQQQMDYSNFQCSALNTQGNEVASQLIPASQLQPPPPAHPLHQQPYIGWNNVDPSSNMIPSMYNAQSQSYVGGYIHLPNKPSQQALMQNQVATGCTQATKRLRPTEELRDFLMGIVEGQYQDESILPHQSQEYHQIEQFRQQPPLQQQEALLESQGQTPQRRFLSGGGIVEMKPILPEHAPEHNQPIVDPTREWFNSLTCSTVDRNEFGGNEENTLPPENPNSDIFEIDLDKQLEKDSLITDVPSTSIQGSSNKNSKIAEILESPCLNDDNANEFDCKFKQLEEALHGQVVVVKEKGTFVASNENVTNEGNEDGKE